MISNTLPPLLRATYAGRFKEGEDEQRFSPNVEEAIDHKGTGDVSRIIPETFHMTLPKPIRFEVLIRALSRICYRHQARLEFEPTAIHKGELDRYARVRVLIKPRYRKPFEALLFSEGDFVSLISFP